MKNANSYVAIDIYNYLAQSGVKRKSGRYRWGSGDTPYQHEPWFTWGKNEWLNEVYDLEEQGWTNAQLAEKYGMSVSAFKAKRSNEANAERIKMISANETLINEGVTNRSERARRMGVNESTIRSLEDAKSKEKTLRAKNTADILKEQVDRLGPIDITAGAELQLGVSKAKMKQAIKMLEEQGYEVYSGRFEQLTNEGMFTTTTVLCPPGTGHYNKNGEYVSDIVYHPELINAIDIAGGVHEMDMTSDDGGLTFRKSFQYPASMDSSRIMVRYGDEGGMENDGTIEIRPGVADLSLGASHYAQVRILVDDEKYMKGMAHYMSPETAASLPEGIDVIYNSRKERGKDPFKTISPNPDNPFNSLIKEKGGQSTYIDPETGERKLSLINKRADEGDWDEWSDKLASQFLSKQRRELVDKQLALSIAEKRDELDTIMNLDNPTLRREFLIDFAQAADKDAVHLKAAALPGQKYKVILPVNSLKEDEVYAPEFDNGTVVALVRFPHGGTFEIPILKVNNNVKEGKDKLGTSPLDAIGINYKAAQQLSGADFDGDTVLIIPNAKKQKILATHPLKGLSDFDPEAEYGYGDIDDSKKKIMKEDYKQIQMGVVSNLISDMTLKGAPPEELAAATRHSMVVIDAVKHELDYTRSAKDNNIEALKKKYQGHYDLNGVWKEEGASTIISRAKNQWDVPATQGDPHINPDTGELEWKPKMKKVIDKSTGKKVEVPDPGYTDSKGVYHPYTKETTQMAAVKDARLLISDTSNPIEVAYANYANELKAMANEARKESVKPGNKLVYNKQAAIDFSDAVDSIKRKIISGDANAPYERAAQREATVNYKKKLIMESDLDPKNIDNYTLEQVEKSTRVTKKEQGKIKQQELTKARNDQGAQRYTIDITDREWEAIQNGAISDHMLTKVMKYADTDKLKQRAMPRDIDVLSDAKQNRIRSMENSGYTISEIAERMDISPTTVKKYLSVTKAREQIK